MTRSRHLGTHAIAELQQKGTVGFDGLAVGGQQNKMSRKPMVMAGSAMTSMRKI